MAKSLASILAVTLLSAFLMAGCGGAAQPNNSQSAASGDHQTSITAPTQPVVDNSGQAAPKVKTDTGRYVGQIDGNSIEIRVSGVPDEISAKAFRLGDAVKAGFDGYNLKEGEEIKFNYQENEHGQPVITEITRLKNN